MTRETVLLLGNYRATIVCARELDRAGYRVVVGCGGDEEGGAEYSRACAGVWRHQPVAAAGLFRQELTAYLAAHPETRIVFPISESYLRFFAENLALLPPEPTYVMAQPDIVRAMLDKAESYAIAASAGLPVAPFVSVGTIGDLHRSGDAVGFPLIVRPFDSNARLQDRKAVVCRDEADLVQAFPVWPAGQPSLLVQRWVSGRRHNIYFAANRGRPFRMLESVARRTDRIDGTGLAVDAEIVPLRPDVSAYTRALLEKLKYHGVGLAQFLVDGDEVHFIELNPRIGGSHALAAKAGLELSPLAVALARSDDVTEPYREGRPGIRYAWAYGELRALKQQFKDGTIGVRPLAASLLRLAASALRADVQDTWSWRDPMPALVAYAKGLRSGGRAAPRAESRSDALGCEVEPHG